MKARLKIAGVALALALAYPSWQAGMWLGDRVGEELVFAINNLSQ